MARQIKTLLSVSFLFLSASLNSGVVSSIKGARSNTKNFVKKSWSFGVDKAKDCYSGVKGGFSKAGNLAGYAYKVVAGKRRKLDHDVIVLTGNEKDFSKIYNQSLNYYENFKKSSVAGEEFDKVEVLFKVTAKNTENGFLVEYDSENEILLIKYPESNSVKLFGFHKNLLSHEFAQKVQDSLKEEAKSWK